MPGPVGAPLLDAELPEIMKAVPVAVPYLPQEHLDVIERQGPVSGIRGAMTTAVYQHRACVFVHYDEHGIAKCSIETAFNQRKFHWRKPISCHLFPIRIDRFGPHSLRYEQIAECAPGVQRGKKLNLPLAQFLREPLIRAYDERWYALLIERVRELESEGECS